MYLDPSNPTTTTLRMTRIVVPSIKDLNFADPMFIGLSDTEYDELFFQIHMITEYMVALDPSHSLEQRVCWFMDMVEYCYTNTLCMLRLPSLRNAIMKRFQDYFDELASGKEIPLNLRDKMNRMFGMMVENNRNLLHHRLWMD